MKTNQQHYKRGTVTLAAHYRLVEGAIWAKRCLPRVAMTLLALFSFIGARAQQTLTVCDGTDSNSFVPFYGYYADTQGAASECVIPSHLLGEMAGSTITAMTFYLLYPAAEAWTGTHQVYIGEVDATTLTGITGPNLFTVVKTASFDATGAELTVVFDEPYTYGGGNLLIGTYVSVEGNCKSAHFYGVNQTENTGWYRGTSTHSGYGVKFIPKTTFTYEPSTTCAMPSTFEVSDITNTGATLEWEDTGAESYSFEYKKASDTEWTQIIIDEQGGAGNESFVYTLSGLEPKTDYYARVRAICGEGSESFYKSLSFTTPEPCPDGKVCIGTGTATNVNFPANNLYKYTLTEQIYTADEIGEAGAILSLDFFKASDTEMVKDLDIYIVSTDKTAFESTAERITVTASDLVYSGTVTFADNDWTTIELDEPFVYDGNRNICIVVDDNTGSYKNDTPFRVFDASGYQSICYLSDDTNLDPTGAISVLGTRYSKKNRIRLGFGEPPACPKPTGLAASNITAHTATLTWTAPATENPVTSYVYQYKKASDTEWSTGASVTTTSVALSGLNGQTTYDFQVQAVYTDGASTFKATTFTTLEVAPAPTDLSATPLVTTAEVSWNGFAESYELEYAEGIYATGGWLQYDGGTFRTGIGNSTAKNWTWGVMYPGRMVTSDQLTKVSIYENSANTEDITINIYSGGDDAPGTLLYTETVAPDAADAFHEITLASPVEIPQGQNLWITLTEQGTYVLSACTSDEANNNWVNSGGTWAHLSDLASTLDGYGWMIRAELAGGNDHSTAAWIAVENPSSPFTLEGLNPETTYTFRVRGDFGDEGVSDWAMSVFTTNAGTEDPIDLAATNITTTSATLDWTGYQDSYNVKYRHERSSVDPAEPATIILEAHDVWGDGSGYQMLLDANATAYGTIIPETWGLTQSGDASAETYAEFEYKIPGNADGSMTTQNMVFDGSVTIQIPAGTYDWCITNPSPDDRVWIAGSNGNVDGRYDDFVFEPGVTYHFTMQKYGDNDGVDLTEIPPMGDWITVDNVTRPYKLTGLTPNTYYEWQVQGILDDGTTEWVSGNSFTTLESPPCLQPTDLATTYVGDRTATLSWTGYNDSYHVEYRKPEPASVLLSEDFEYASDFEARWNVVNNSVNYSERNDGKIERRYREPRHGGDYSFCFSSCSYGDSFEEYIISKDALTGVTNETVMEFYYSWSEDEDYIQVGYSSTTNDIASFTFGEPFSSSGGWGQFHEAVPVGTKYVAIKYTAAERYLSNIYIDDITIGNPADWQTVDTNEATVTLTGLEPATTYDVRVQGDCGNGDVSPVSETLTFTTLEYLPGDVNSDGGVTIADVLAVVEYILNDGYTTGNFNYQAANVDTSDYNITIADAVKILEIILKGGPNTNDPSSDDGHDYVDLALPSGTLWATCNVGASKPEEYGYYFAWGETVPFGQEDTSNTRNYAYAGNDTKTYYDWGTYKWCEGSSTTMTKYCNNSSYGYNGFTDGKTELDLEDDAAYVNWGQNWCMPTQTQWDELRTNCTWTWKTNGYEVTGTNGNSIFLPAAGYRNSNSISGLLKGYYWSRTLNEVVSKKALYLNFLSSNVYLYSIERYYGLSVRPVRR